MNEADREVGLIGGPEKGSIEIREYDERWPEIFRAHAERIARALGSAALRIEHIGSTSVPGLGAKPVVDILLVVEDSCDEDAYLPPLLEAGYELRVREPEFDEHRMLRTPERDVHIHVYSPSSIGIERHLIFRDQLRRNADDRRRYEEVKRMLAQREWEDTNEYAEAKSEIVEQIIRAGRGEQETCERWAPEGGRARA